MCPGLPLRDAKTASGPAHHLDVARRVRGRPAVSASPLGLVARNAFFRLRSQLRRKRHLERQAGHLARMEERFGFFPGRGRAARALALDDGEQHIEDQGHEFGRDVRTKVRPDRHLASASREVDGAGLTSERFLHGHMGHVGGTLHLPLQRGVPDRNASLASMEDEHRRAICRLRRPCRKDVHAPCIHERRVWPNQVVARAAGDHVKVRTQRGPPGTGGPRPWVRVRVG